MADPYLRSGVNVYSWDYEHVCVCRSNPNDMKLDMNTLRFKLHVYFLEIVYVRKIEINFINILARLINYFVGIFGCPMCIIYRTVLHIIWVSRFTQQ